MIFKTFTFSTRCGPDDAFDDRIDVDVDEAGAEEALAPLRLVQEPLRQRLGPDGPRPSRSHDEHLPAGGHKQVATTAEGTTSKDVSVHGMQYCMCASLKYMSLGKIANSSKSLQKSSVFIC